jgi:hypothetical protein
MSPSREVSPSIVYPKFSSRPGPMGHTTTSRPTPNQTPPPVISKRRRFSVSLEDQTAGNSPSKSSYNSAKSRRMSQKEGLRKDEKALMDDLMAGLDASIFDMPFSSPVHPISVPVTAPRVVSQSLLSGLDASMFDLPVSSPDNSAPHRASQGSPTVLKSRKRVIMSPKKRLDSQIVKTRIEPPKDGASIRSLEYHAEAKHSSPPHPVIFDEAQTEPEEIGAEFDDEMYHFDVDLSELAAMDDEDLLMQVPKVGSID